MATTRKQIIVGILLIGFGVLAWNGWQYWNSTSFNLDSDQVVSEVISKADNLRKINTKPYPSIFFDEQLFQSGIDFADKKADEQIAQNYDDVSPRAAIISHHLLASDIIADIVRRVAQANPQTVIILAPNHYERGALVLTSANTWKTPFGGVQVNGQIAQNLARLPFVKMDSGNVLAAEHAVGALVPFVKHYLPQAKIVPIVARRAMSRAQMEELANKLAQIAVNSDVAILASVDFAHNATEDQARKINNKILELIDEHSYEKIIACGSGCADAPQVLVTFLRILRKLELNDKQVLHNTNAAEISGLNNLNVTSYLGIVFAR